MQQQQEQIQHMSGACVDLLLPLCGWKNRTVLAAQFVFETIVPSFQMVMDWVSGLAITCISVKHVYLQSYIFLHLIRFLDILYITHILSIYISK